MIEDLLNEIEKHLPKATREKIIARREVLSCRWCAEGLRRDRNGDWVDVFDAYLCDHPRNELHEVWSEAEPSEGASDG